MIDTTKIDSLVATALTSLRASTAAELVDGAPPRALSHGPLWTPPDSNGNIARVEITLVPVTYRVATQLGLYLWFTVDPSGATVILRESPWPRAPGRADLVEATRLAVEGESRAVEVAIKALDDTGDRPPTRSWAESLFAIMLDPRLPVPDFSSDSLKSWHLLFDPHPGTGTGGRRVSLEIPGFAVWNIR
jgi:hypothetical protein